MGEIKDDAEARLSKVERTLRRLQDEMEALRDEIRGTAADARERADAARAETEAAKHRTEKRLTATKDRVGRAATKQMKFSEAASGRARHARVKADAADGRAVEISKSSGERTRRYVKR